MFQKLLSISILLVLTDKGKSAVVTVIEGQDAKIEYPYSNPQINIRLNYADGPVFYVDGMVVQSALSIDQITRYSVSKTEIGATFTISNVRREDAGTIECSLYEPNGRIIKTFNTLSVRFPPDDVSCTFDPPEDPENPYMILTCSSLKGQYPSNILCYRGYLEARTHELNTATHLVQKFDVKGDDVIINCCASLLESPTNRESCDQFVYPKNRPIPEPLTTPHTTRSGFTYAKQAGIVIVVTIIFCIYFGLL